MRLWPDGNWQAKTAARPPKLTSGWMALVVSYRLGVGHDSLFLCCAGLLVQQALNGQGKESDPITLYKNIVPVYSYLSTLIGNNEQMNNETMNNE